VDLATTNKQNLNRQALGKCRSVLSISSILGMCPKVFCSCLRLPAER
jgi:hypothetical protein